MAKNITTTPPNQPTVKSGYTVITCPLPNLAWHRWADALAAYWTAEGTDAMITRTPTHLTAVVAGDQPETEWDCLYAAAMVVEGKDVSPASVTAENAARLWGGLGG